MDGIHGKHSGLVLGDGRIFFRRKASNAMRFSGRAIGIAEPTSLCVCVGALRLGDNIRKSSSVIGACFANDQWWVNAGKLNLSAGPALHVLTMER